MLRISPHIHIDDSEISLSYVRSPGPGGQNVNKVSTAAQLRFDYRNSPTLPNFVKERLAQETDHRITASGIIVIEASRFRSQRRNRDDAIERLVHMLLKAAAPRKKRRPTKPSKASIRRRLDSKRKRSEVKQLRKNIDQN